MSQPQEMSMEEAIAATIAEHCAPGKPLELGMDTWTCNGVKVSGVGFIAGPSTLRQYYNVGFSKFPNAEFIVYKSERYTYSQVHKIILGVIKYYTETLGVKQGDRVAVCMPNYPDWAFHFIAATYLGAIAVPLNGWWTTDELEYGLSDSGSAVVVVDEARFRRLIPLLEKKTLKAKVILVRADKSLAQKYNISHSSDIPKSGPEINIKDVTTDAVGVIMYTSGTTGHPKGVVQTHRGVCNQERFAMIAELLKEKTGQTLPPGEAPCIICPVPLFHVTASHHIFLTSIASGRKVVLMTKWDAGEALKLIEKERPQAWQGVPTLIQDMMEHPDFPKTDTSSLRLVGSGGAPNPQAQVAKVPKKFKNGAPQQGYGLTETNGAVSFIAGDDYIKRPGSCGKAFPICSAAVIDEQGNRLKPGEKGELLIKSPLVMLEYWNKKKKTDEVFIDFGEGGGWFKTGDVAKIDEEGYIYILDRQKDIIIRGGENISCAEVESALFETGDVMECAVFGIKHERLGEEVGAVVVLKEGVSEEGMVEKLLGSARHKLASFKIPKKEHVFFKKGVLPRGATGKILKREIRDEINAKLEAQKQKAKL